jgi:hypothetical protein
MRPRVLAGLGLEYHLDDAVGTALLARAAAIQVRRTQGPTVQVQDLAALSLGAMAVLDAEVTKRATAGLGVALAIARVPSPLGAVAVAISAATTDYEFAPLPPPELLRSAPLGYAVFSLLWPIDYAGDILEAISRDDGEPIGRLGIAAYRWARLAAAEAGAQRSAAARWILDRGAEEVERAMRDAYHWRRLHAGLAPVEPELLLAALILLREEPERTRFEAAEDAAGHPVVRAAIVTAASMRGDERLAERLGGADEPVYGAAGERWRRWQDRISEGPYPLAW